MRRSSFAFTVALPFFLIGLAACGDEDPVEPIERFDLTFSGDASFQGQHGSQTIHVALVRRGIVSLRIIEISVVSATADPSFSFNFPGRLIEGQEYDLDYWIDSNFGGGTPETCDPPGNDYHWRIDVGVVTDDVVIEDTLRPTETESVCATFE